MARKPTTEISKLLKEGVPEWVHEATLRALAPGCHLCGAKSDQPCSAPPERLTLYGVRCPRADA